MKAIRILLQSVLILASLFGIAVVVLLMLNVDSIGGFEIENIFYFTPNAVWILLFLVLGAFADSMFFIVPILISFSFVIGVALRGRSRWAYRILVYPTLLLSAVSMFSEFTLYFAVAALYLVIAIIVDILP